MTPCILLRSHNDMPLIGKTLEALHRQDHPFRLIALDNESTDGTREELLKYTDAIETIPRGTYVPGRVLNRGMAMSTGELVVFLNSDCTPQHKEWLRNLLQGFDTDRTAAVFGRQIPRPDCHPLLAKDTEDTYGDGLRQQSWRHCFSMAASAIRRSVWKDMPFREEIQYSEDIDWTWRARQKGWNIRYVPDAVVMHSHNYTLKQFYRRHYGEGKAEAAIFDWSPWERSFVRYSLLPCIRQVVDDIRYSFARGLLSAAAFSPALRLAQLLGRRKGFCAGLKEDAR
jgi:rhamnosyltransferase